LAILYLIIPYAAVLIPIAIILPIAFILLIVVGVEVGAIVIIAILAALVLTYPFSPFIGAWMIHMGKTGRGNMLIDRNVQFRDRLTRRINKRRIV
jgi:hypothetical protein